MSDIKNRFKSGSIKCALIAAGIFILISQGAKIGNEISTPLFGIKFILPNHIIEKANSFIVAIDSFIKATLHALEKPPPSIPYPHSQSGLIWSSSFTGPGKHAAYPVSNTYFSDFTLEADLIIDGSDDEYHGLMLRFQDEVQDTGKFYSFRIAPGGFYVFDIWRPGTESYVNLLGPTRSVAIKTGVGERNHLRVVAKEDRFDLSINGSKIGTVTDGTYTKGKLGFVSCTCRGSSKSSVSFYDFSVTPAM